MGSRSLLQAAPRKLTNTAGSFKALTFNRLLRKSHQFYWFAWLSLGNAAHQQPLDARCGAQAGLEPVVARCLESADIVAIVFLGWRTKFPRTANAFRIGRCEGPHCFPRNQPRTLASAMHSVAAVELSRNLLSRDFWRRSIFDFCNNICDERKCLRQHSFGHSCQSQTLGEPFIVG